MAVGNNVGVGLDMVSQKAVNVRKIVKVFLLEAVGFKADVYKANRNTGQGDIGEGRNTLIQI